MSEAELEQEQDSSSRISKPLVIRILVVGVFVAVGSYAVMRFMGGKADNAIGATVSLTPNSSDPPKASTAPLGSGPATAKMGIADLGKSKTNSFNPIQESSSDAKGIQPKKFTPPTVKTSGNTNLSDNSFGSPALGPPPPSKAFSPSDNKNPKSGFPADDIKTKAKPPARYAQVPGGVPIIGSKGGFGELQKQGTKIQPKKPATQFDKGQFDKNQFGKNPIDQKLTPPSRTAGQESIDAAAKSISSATDAASDLLRDASKKSTPLVNSLNMESPKGIAAGTPDINPAKKTSFPGTGGAFGSPAKESKSATDPPKVQTGFGGRPKTLGDAIQRTPDSPVKAIGTRLGDNDIKSVGPLTPNPAAKSANDTAKTSPFVETQRSQPDANLPTTQRSNVPVQPISTSLTDRRPTNGFGNNQQQRITGISDGGINGQNSLGGRIDKPASSTSQFGNTRPSNTNLNSRMGAGSIGNSATSNFGRLTKDVPGDRQLDGLQAPALTIEKRSPREIQVNQTAEFEIVVRNVGRATAEDVKVFDEVPSGTEFGGAVPKPTRMAQNRKIEWSVGQLRPGQEKRIKLQLKPIQPGEIGSVAHVTFATQASMRSLVTKPVLEVVHQTNPTHLIGDDVILDVLVTNKGDGAAKNVVIQQEVPKQLDFPDGLPGGSRVIEYEVGTLTPGRSRRVKLALKAADVGRIQNVMFASADGGIQAKHQVPIEIVAPKLVARSDGPTRRFLKRNVTHQFSVTNQGTANATNVELIARLPRGLQFVQSNNQGRYDSNTHAVYWSLAKLTRNAEAKVELKTIPIDVGNQPIRFESSADLNVRASIEQALSVEHLVDVFFDIDDVVDPIEIGASTSYRLRVVNQGTKAASNIQLHVDFPNGVQPTSVDSSLRNAIRGQQIVFEPINSMSPGDEVSIVIHGKGQLAGDHRVVVKMQTDGRTGAVSKQESTHVYSDR